MIKNILRALAVVSAAAALMAPATLMDTPIFHSEIAFAAPSITIRPALGAVKMSMTIYATTGGFGTTQGISKVWFGGSLVPTNRITMWSDRNIIVSVEATTTGNKDVSVEVSGVKSNKLTFNVTSTTEDTTQPSITRFTPLSGEAGTAVVTLEGKNFGTTTTTKDLIFNGHRISTTGTGSYGQLISWSNTKIVFRTCQSYDVSPATTNMYIYISPTQASNTVNFIASSVTGPYIISLSPTSGPVGTEETLTGVNFGSTGEVWFNGAKTNATSWANTSIKFNIPSSATGSRLIFVKVGSISSMSRSFTVTASPPSSQGISNDLTVTRNHPNPFDPGVGPTKIIFGADEPEVKLVIFDLKGKALWTKTVTPKSTGYFEVLWDGGSNFGETVGNGSYPYLVLAGSKVVTRGEIAVWK